MVICPKSLWYPCQNNASTFDAMQAELEATFAAHTPPFFTVVYSCLSMSNSTNLIDFALAMRDRLAPKGVQVVGMQDMVRLARQAAALDAARSGAVAVHAGVA